MVDTIYKILDELNSYYYVYCLEKNRIERTRIHENAACIRDLVTITSKLDKLKIKFIVTENKSIQLLEKN